MNLQITSIAGPFTHENLAIFLLRGPESFDGQRFLPLEEALEQQSVVVHETGVVGQLEVENVAEAFDLYIQAGDIVKGGRQDRTLGVDFVLPAKSGRVPIPSFCVEGGRWSRRGAESAAAFSSSKSSLSHRKLRLAAKLSKSQAEVWDKVQESQQKLSASLSKSVHAAASPSSYLLSIEDEDLRRRQEAYRSALTGIVRDNPDAIGYAFAIDGVLNSADVYGSPTLFRKLWSKLLDAATLEAIAETARDGSEKREALRNEDVDRWLQGAAGGEVLQDQEVPPRVHMETRRTERAIQFDTFDRGLAEAVLHRNVIAP
jgi:predicted transcriptional regulator